MIRCVRFRRFEKNTLQGFVDLELTNAGLVLRDCTWRRKGDQEWIGFPARSYQGKDGTTAWSPLVEFAAGAKEARTQFQQQAIAAVRAAARQQEPAP
jgi:hypothetical protein